MELIKYLRLIYLSYQRDVTFTTSSPVKSSAVNKQCALRRLNLTVTKLPLF